MQLVGKVVQYELAKLKPNPWNPNEMDEFTFQSLKHGFETDGWLASMALLIWGTDEGGTRRDLIIDGEQRWTAGTQLGLKKGPCVFLDGITETQARSLTIKLDQKRGKFNKGKLSALVAELSSGVELSTLGLDLGIGPSQLSALLKPHAIEVPTAPSHNVHTRQVPLYFNEQEAAEFHSLVQDLSKVLKTETVTDTVMVALRRAAAQEEKKAKKAARG